VSAPAGGARAILTDIEGTTSSIAFVKEVLFPFARAHLAGYVAAHAGDAEVRRCLDDARAIAGDPAMRDDAVIALLLRWIDEDRKLTPLKTLQGLVWEIGYRSGALTSHVYDDALAGLTAWHAAGLPIYVFSSGSIAAQRLLFGHTAQGDVTWLFRGHFDTTIGGKLEAASYRAIARAVGLPPAEILFLSDHAGELDAAAAAGMRTLCLDRGEAAIPAGTPHRRAASFADIDLLARLPLGDEELWLAFGASKLPAGAWTHREHLRVAWMFLKRYPLDEAHLLMRVGIIRLNASHGLVETPTRGYHETLTRLWLALIAARMKIADAPSSAAFVDAHLGSLGKDAALGHYSRARLESARARAVFVEPDLAPLPD
jgi:enolase-phosphatase E1